MKIYSIIPIVIILAITADKCKNKNESNSYKGRLESKGMCMNYTIKLLEGKLDTSKIASEWKNEATGKIHNNVFALGSVSDCGRLVHHQSPLAAARVRGPVFTWRIPAWFASTAVD